MSNPNLISFLIKYLQNHEHKQPDIIFVPESDFKEDGTMNLANAVCIVGMGESTLNGNAALIFTTKKLTELLLEPNGVN